MSRGTTRRDVLRAGAMLTAIAALPGCDKLYTGLAHLHEPDADPVRLAGGSTIDPGFHLLSRATYGARPGDLARLDRLGRDAWIDEQLSPSGIDDRACDIRTAQCESLADSPAELMSVREKHIDSHLVRHTLIRAVHSRRQLLEVMVGFWHDHLSIDSSKRGCIQTKPLDEREVVRKHALGRFRDLIRASALSPAMLFYLDGRQNGLKEPGDKPNENYARELLELHTLGVRGGYTQRDVMETARCLTGWTTKKRWMKGLTVEFVPKWHDDGEKVVLGRKIPAGGGKQDLERLLDIVCRHPSTARYLATKLCRRFVADPPPSSVVDSTASVFSRTDGDLEAVVRHILSSPEFTSAAGAKVKRPLRFMASAMRALDAECRAGKREIEFMNRLGHVPFHYPTPDGYPEEAEPWMGGLLWRWNFALALVNGRLDRSEADIAALVRRAGFDPLTASPVDLAPLFFGRVAMDAERAAVDAFIGKPATGKKSGPRRREAVALLLCAPAFQVH